MQKTEVIIVGAGPIGIEAAAVMKRLEVPYLHFEAGQIGSTIQRWPRDTRFFSSPERVAVAGIPVQTVSQEQLTGEHYLAYLRGVVEILGLQVRTYEKVVAINGKKGNFRVTTQTRTDRREYASAHVVIATGDMNGPAILGIPGEDLPHVTHYFQDPHPYFQKETLIVGGRNSAVEAALRCFRAGAKVTLSYRRPFFDRARVNSRLHLELGILLRKGKVRFYPETIPVEIDDRSVLLKETGGTEPSEHRVSADFVILCTGFQIDLSLLKMADAKLDGEEEIPVIDEDSMETTVPGLYLAGTVVSGNKSSERQFIGTSHHHSVKIAKAVTGLDIEDINTVSARRYPFTRKDLEIDEEQKTY